VRRRAAKRWLFLVLIVMALLILALVGLVLRPLGWIQARIDADGSRDSAWST
jgi:Tfp pilus assembly protein PilX